MNPQVPTAPSPSLQVIYLMFVQTERRNIATSVRLNVTDFSNNVV